MRFEIGSPIFPKTLNTSGIDKIEENNNVLPPSVTVSIGEMRLEVFTAVQCDENQVLDFDKNSFFISMLR